MKGCFHLKMSLLKTLSILFCIWSLNNQLLTLSVAELKCNISVKKVLEADVLDSLLMLAPLGTALGLGSEQHRIC